MGKTDKEVWTREQVEWLVGLLSSLKKATGEDWADARNAMRKVHQRLNSLEKKRQDAVPCGASSYKPMSEVVIREGTMVKIHGIPVLLKDDTLIYCNPSNFTSRQLLDMYK